MHPPETEGPNLQTVNAHLMSEHYKNPQNKNCEYKFNYDSIGITFPSFSTPDTWSNEKAWSTVNSFLTMNRQAMEEKTENIEHTWASIESHLKQAHASNKGAKPKKNLRTLFSKSNQVRPELHEPSETKNPIEQKCFYIFVCTCKIDNLNKQQKQKNKERVTTQSIFSDDPDYKKARQSSDEIRVLHTTPMPTPDEATTDTSCQCVLL